MKLIMDLLLMLGGVGVFMFGMKQMNQGIEKSAGAGVRGLFKKINKNRAVNYGVGVSVASIVHSSTTAIMTVGLANAEIVTVKQGSGIVLGAKVGTTLIAFIVALTGYNIMGGFSFSDFFAAFVFVGVLIIYMTSKESLGNIALMMVGFGMLFVGLEVMEFALSGSELSATLEKLFRFDLMFNPFFLVLLGVVFTLIIQSSTAATFVFLSFLATGVISSLDQSFFLVMGANIGTCSDGLMASIGTNAYGKRIAIFHTLTSSIGAVAFSIILIILKNPVVSMFENAFGDNRMLSLATYNLAYNTIYTLILLPFLNPLVNFVEKIVKEKTPPQEQHYQLSESLLATPTVAVEQALKEVVVMSRIAWENFGRAFDGIINNDMRQSKKIADDEYLVDDMTRTLAGFFIKISSLHASAKDETIIGGLHHVINDIERIGDHAVLLAIETNYMDKGNLQFLDQTKNELRVIYLHVGEMYRLGSEAFSTRRTDNLKRISEIHLEVIDLIKKTMDLHIERLSSNMYSVEVSKSIYAVLQSLQRVADHIVNISFSIVSKTGSKKEAFEQIKTRH